ncbi:condensation domain-containing protein, partial [Kitasatospora sp. NPDC047058]|uniref:condensation domain-containing protein n=1 Tax=Kitasatospora sp. NPDC047058 TaxID=3155620 RepID=UPI0033D8790F
MRTSRLEDVHPLTALQSGLYFHARLAGDDTDVYTAQLTLDLAGPLDPQALRRACSATVRRHSALRTGFRTRPTGDPAQFVVRGLDAPWAESDLRAEEPALRAPLRAALLDGDRREPFDLARPPLVRFRLIRTGEEQWTLALTNHHLILDGWSFPLLVEEVFRAYAGAADPGEPPSFRSYLEWMAGQDRAAAGAAWRLALDGLD